MYLFTLCPKDKGTSVRGSSARVGHGIHANSSWGLGSCAPNIVTAFQYFGLARLRFGGTQNISSPPRHNLS